ncbi:MAG: ZIP family metal transporter, partial [Lachnospiraceae bacterium]|nr:ZIP family metal transporter [Lachnospiraceae bacterium]
RHSEFPGGGNYFASLPSRGKSRFQAFGMGVLSGAVEPLAAMMTVLLAGIVTPLLPYMLAFAAAAMIYVTVEELIPEMAGGRTAHIGTLAFAAGFAVMMVLDVALG